MSGVGVDSFFHEDKHPWLHRTVRDIASRSEGELTAIVHEKTGSRTVRVAHIRLASGVEFSTSIDNVQLVTGLAYAAGDGASISPCSRTSPSSRPS
ncbi:hypothetical protein [Streptomyces gardneri]|uniref:hypothetical protein n=1 Tax=Streptomyces gardneri TaxID=66892 RepID=UPI0035D9AE77